VLLLQILFWLLVLLDLAVLGVFFVLALAAAGPSHTSPFAVVGFFAVPVLVLLGAVALFLWKDSTAWRGLATLLVASPLLFVLVGNRAAVLSLKAYETADGSMSNFRSGPLREIESAIQRNDLNTVVAKAHGAELNERGRMDAPVLKLALERKPPSKEIVQALLEAGANPNNEDILGAALPASPEILRLLLAAGAKPNQKGPTGSPAYFRLIGYSTSVEQMQALLDYGADLNLTGSGGMSALIQARNTQNWRLLKFLLEKGADGRAARTLSGETLQQVLEDDLSRTYIKNKEDLREILQILKNR